MKDTLVMTVVGVAIILIAFGTALYKIHKRHALSIYCPTLEMVIVVIGLIISLSGVALGGTDKIGSYEIYGQYVIVYTEDRPVKYFIDPVTEGVVLHVPHSENKVVTGETKEEFFKSLKEKGYKER